MGEWKEEILENIAVVNPLETIKKGVSAKKVAMEILQPFTKRIPGCEFEEYKGGVKFRNGDILIARITPSLENGKTAYVDILEEDEVGFGSTEFIVLREKKNVSDKHFLYYLAISPEFREVAILSMTGSSGRQRVQTDVVKSHAFLLPPLPEQKAIAAVLSSLDDKIDLLHRQNKTLEALAETLFRQWFVEEAGEGWAEVSLEDVTSRITDGAHKSPPTVENGLPMASVKDMHHWGINTASCRLISEEDFNELTAMDCRPLKNDILIAKDGSYLKHVFVVEKDLDVVILSSIAIIRPNALYNPLLLAIFLKLESTKISLENIVTGAVIPRIVLKDFRKFRILLPPKEIQDQALVYIRPLYKKCWENNHQIRNLEKLRDTLLPKLMRGEVRVKL